MPTLKKLTSEIKSCRICVDRPSGTPLPHEPRPVLQVHRSARVGVFGQAPGKRVHESGKPFTDPSGDRLRAWLDVSADEFYDDKRIAIVPMGFCFPGYNEKGADLPPRKECAAKWREPLIEAMPNLDLCILIGGYAQKWHLGANAKKTLTETVAAWRDYEPKFIPTPHPSWRNNTWLKKNPWFEEDLLPVLRRRVHSLI